MKIKFLLFAVLFVAQTIQSSAQGGLRYTIQVYKFEMNTNSSTTVHATEAGYSFIIEAERGEVNKVTRMDAQAQRSLFKLAPNFNIPRGQSGCPECATCFESEQLQQTVCICKSCGTSGGGKAKSMLKIYTHKD